MFLSIIVPVYNVEKYLSRCLDSLIQQDIDIKDYEIIIVNDGSTDSSPFIAEQYAQEYSQIKVINQLNKGLSGARNTGINNSNAKYLFFIDSDDYIQINVMNGLLNIALANDLDLLGFGMKRTAKSNDYSKINSSLIEQKNKYIKVYNGVTFISKFNFNNGACWYVIKKELILANNLYFEQGRMVEDGQFTTELLLFCNKVAYIKADIYMYYINPNSITTKRSKEHLKKLNEDFKFAIKKFEVLIQLAQEKKANNKAILRLNTRQESYVFFLFIRLIQADISFKEFQEVIKDLKQINVYPIRNFIGKDYNSKKEKILTRIFNNQILLFILLKLNKTFKVIK